MCCKSFVKRVIPFFLTFSVGLLIASLFVTVAAPNFSFGKRAWSKHREYHMQMERENQRLRTENLRLEQKIAELAGQTSVEKTFEFDDLDLSVAPPPLVKPIPPAKAR